MAEEYSPRFYLSKIRSLTLKLERLRTENADLKDKLKEWETCYGDMKNAHFWERSGGTTR